MPVVCEAWLRKQRDDAIEAGEMWKRLDDCIGLTYTW